MDKTLEFDYMYKDEVCTHVFVNFTKQEIKVQQYGDTPIKSVFWKMPQTMENLFVFFEYRCFERTRCNKKQILEEMGLSEYEPLAICKITHGYLTSDCFWIRFAGENLCYEDIKQGGEK